MEEDKNIKITLLGNQGVGKKCVISRYINDIFPENQYTMVIANYLEKIIIRKKEKIRLDIWNSIGQEKFLQFGKYFYNDSQIICFIYDITDSESFNNIKNIWYPQFQQNGNKNAILGIVGNKSDLFENEILELEDDAKAFAKDIGAIFMLISAKTGNGIQKLFDNLINLYFEKFNNIYYNNIINNNSIIINDNNKNDNQNKYNNINKNDNNINNNINNNNINNNNINNNNINNNNINNNINNNNINNNNINNNNINNNNINNNNINNNNINNNINNRNMSRDSIFKCLCF